MKQKKYSLEIRNDVLVYLDDVEAENKDEAVLKFIEQMPQSIRKQGWGVKEIVYHYVRVSML